MLKLSIFTTILLLCSFAAIACHAHTIKHIVVVMLENRAFDLVSGLRPGVDGVTVGGNCNPIDINDPSQGSVCVSADAYQVARCDPNHDTWAMEQKAFGFDNWRKNNFTGKPTNKGFVDAERRINSSNADFCDVMKVFPTSALPVTNAMADEFALFQKYFTSFLSPTWPERLYFLQGTSAGLSETSSPWFQNQEGLLYPGKTIFDQVLEAGLTAKYYANDTWWELMVESLAHKPELLHLTTDFFEDARTGNLPSFSYINPRCGVDINTGATAQDGHPDHAMQVLEAFVKDLYEAVRAGPSWNDTLFIYHWDEAGGFFDHVPPPTDAPAPDDYPSWPDQGIGFNLLGFRIPVIMMSPWIPKGALVDFPPASAKPFPNSQFEQTSIMATVRKLLGIPDVNLTRRDAWAARFDFLFDILTEPRTDCPMHLPDALPPPKSLAAFESSLPMNSLQRHHAEVHGMLSGRGFPDHIELQSDISPWLQTAAKEHHDRTIRWKRSKTTSGGVHHSKAAHNVKKTLDSLLEQKLAKSKDGKNHKSWIHKNLPEVEPQYYLRCQAMIQHAATAIDVTNSWMVDIGPISTPYRTIAASIPVNASNANNNSSSEWYCITLEETLQPGDEIGMSLCYPVRHPSGNRDKYQWFVTPSDRTVRPYLNQNLCVTQQCYPQNSQFVARSSALTLEKCTPGNSNQIWSYQGLQMGIQAQQHGTWNAGDAIQAMAVTLYKDVAPYTQTPP